MMTKDEYQHYMDLAVKANEKMYRQMKNETRNEGKTEGKDEEKKEMAKKLYDAGIDVQIIKDTTGFTKRQIKKICL